MKYLGPRISIRLFVGFFVVLLIFAFVALVTLNSLQKMQEATGEIRELQKGLEAGFKMAADAHKLSVHQAYLTWTEDHSHVERFRSSLEQMNQFKERLRAEIATDEERVWMRRLDRATSEFANVFFTELVPAVRRHDEEKVESINRRSAELLDEITELCKKLSLGFEREIYEATGRAIRVGQNALRQTVGLFGFAVLVAIIAAFYLARSILDPVGELIRGTETISGGDLAHTIRVGRTDEFGQLADSFNRMTRELRSHQQQLIQAEKMASVGRLAAGVAHEINNPIGVILGYVKVMLAGKKPGDPQYEDLKTIEEEALQCKRIVQDLLDLSRPMKMDTEVFDLREVISDVVDRAEKQEPFGKVSVDVQLSSTPIQVTADRARLRQVVMNLVSNGTEAMPEGGKLTIRAYERTSTNGLPDKTQLAVIEVADTGCGITPENRRHLFEPFFSTKKNGTGLGLAISYGIVKAHDGFIDLETQPGRGTTFTVGLPVR